MFFATFQCEGDRRRVLEDHSWHFDLFLMIFANLDGLDTLTPDQLYCGPFWVQAHNIPLGRKSLQLAQFIADELGDLIEIHPLSLLESFGPYLCICILLDVTKPPRRGMNIHFWTLARTKWISFKFEGLQNFCYFCGLLDHTYNKCRKYILRCDNFPVPPKLGYKEHLRVPAKTNLKKNPFKLSNSTPINEYVPRTTNSDQGLQQAVDQFLNMDFDFAAPILNSTNPISSSKLPPQHTDLHQTTNPVIPQPIMTTSVITHTDKGKGIAIPESQSPHPIVSSTTRNKSLTIREPTTTPITAIISGSKCPITRQTAQIGGSVESMLKRARATPNNEVVVPSLSDNEETTGVVLPPRRGK
uniref:Zinc knuckle CX2CX4HX4C domain-containing protein n=1 Tax=Cannabis sativa TaxID=3483 RepID=A0A803PUD3_CANSA